MDRHHYNNINSYAVDPRKLGLWYLNSCDKRTFNVACSVFVILMMAQIITMRLMIGSSFGIFCMLLVYLSEALILLSVRYWWIWNCNYNDQFFIVNMKVKFSAILMLLSIIMVWVTILIVQAGFEVDHSEVFAAMFSWPILIIATLVNTINGIRLLKLYFTWLKLFRVQGKPIFSTK